MAEPDPATPVVLVVEDEPLLRLHAVALIEEAGFKTVEAAHAEEAVAILVGRADIRVVFTDIDMPGEMDGIELAATIRDRWPPIGIILASGFRAPRAEDLPERALFFPKPYDETAVVNAIRLFAT